MIQSVMIMEGKKWTELTYEEKNRQLYLQQKELLDTFLEHKAITQAQHDKSLQDLTGMMDIPDLNI